MGLANEVEEVIEEVREEICDKYCKYSDKQEQTDEICEKCPLNKL